ncbi:RICIN domain-containing protein [Fulvivirga sp. 29W222]|uniref:RICIN domain-containing protein n=1 Tax=Fulvivirga marina TaxID=2494733 RepID=A0A937G059_9BACT|nr:pectinesterase family protein [Fulvivirga marina]MBL6449279.1 RICIN domain-containing protein [Fulvivirga marina]
MMILRKSVKFIMAFICIGLFFCSGYAAQEDADIIVAKDGSGDYTSIQAAINSVPDNSSTRTVIYIKSGLYNTEKLIIPSEKKNVTIQGEDRTSTIISYHIYNCSEGSGKCPVDDAALWPAEVIRTSATLTIKGDGFKAENLTIQNTAGPVGQAQAITVQADKVVFLNCDLKSYQDTIYFWNVGKRAYFNGCLIVGRTDYIYGGGVAFFEACEIRSWGGGWITAPSTAESQKYGFVFYKCSVTYADNSPRNGDDGNKIAFGRPWHNYPKVAWLYCDMTSMINPEGWPTTWNMDYAATSDKLELYEYKNTGGGADMSGRANWAGIRALTDAEAALYERATVLAGTDNWNPSPPAATLQKHGAGSSIQTVDLGSTIEGFYYSWTNATSVTVSGLPSGISTTINTGDQTVTFSGTPIEAGIFNYTVSTVGGLTTASHSGQITVNNVNYYQLKNRSTGLLLDGMGRTNNGGACGQYANTTHVNSHWKLVDVGNGYYQFVNRGTGMILDGLGSTTNGAACGQWANTTHRNSHWSLQKYDGDYYRIKNRSSGMFLDGYGQSANGADCKQYANTNHPNAQWLLIQVNNNASSTRMYDAATPNVNTSDFLVYPNPFEDKLFINIGQSGTPLSLELYNMQGKLIKSIDKPVVSDQSVTINIAEYGKQFILKMVTDQGSFIQTVIKK